MPKHQGMTKSEGRNFFDRALSDFVFCHCFDPRHSSFVISQYVAARFLFDRRGRAPLRR
jgi:hypothetical protein